MGQEIALEFKKRDPSMFCEYVARCNAGQIKIGELGSYTIARPRTRMRKWGIIIEGSATSDGKFDWSASPTTDQTLFGDFDSHEVAP